MLQKIRKNTLENEEKYSPKTRIPESKSLFPTMPLFFLIIIAAGFVILLTALTFFSTPILEAIFGNGMVEGEDPDAWWKEIEPRTNPNPAEDEVSINFQKLGFANIFSRLEKR